MEMDWLSWKSMQRSKEFTFYTFVFRNNVSRILWAKNGKSTIQIVLHTKFKSQPIWWRLWVSGTYRSWNNLLFYSNNIFFSGTPCLLQWGNEDTFCRVTTVRLHKKDGYQTGLCSIQTCLPLIIEGSLWSKKYNNRLSNLKCTSIFDQIVSSVPRHLSWSPV